MSTSVRRAVAAGLTAALILGAGVTASSGKSNFPVKVGNCGHSHTYRKAPKRIIIGWPEDAKTLTALGVGRSVIGYLGGKFGPAPGLPNAKKLANEASASAEKILTARPDLFITHGEYQANGKSGAPSVADLAKAGAGVYVLGGYCTGFVGAMSIDTVYRSVSDLGRIFGVPGKAAKVIGQARKRVAATRALRGKRKAPRIAYVGVFDGKLYALKGLSYATQISAIGGVNVFAGLKGNFPEVSAEKVLTLNADAIVYSYGAEAETSAKQRADVVKLLGSTKAVKSGRIIAMPVRLSEGDGLAVIDAIETMARDVYK